MLIKVLMFCSNNHNLQCDSMVTQLGDNFSSFSKLHFLLRLYNNLLSLRLTPI